MTKRYISNRRFFILIFVFVLIAINSVSNGSTSNDKSIAREPYALAALLENHLESNQFSEVYRLLSPQYKNKLNRELFLKLIRDKQLEIHDFSVIKTVIYDSGGYFVATVDYSVEGRRLSGVEVVFFERYKTYWVADNFPLSSYPILCFPHSPPFIRKSES